MTTTNPTPRPEAIRAQILSRYENLTFVPAPRPARKELNMKRGTPSRRKVRVIL